ncbi:hypothetical protein [Methylobacterium tarhaniae]|uniref:hypothetical protein n=1 Tax=Methylobacterium tarhaniae TaxID=1187852 RepID=UPI003D03A0AE
MTEIVFDPDLMAVYEKVERRTEWHVFHSLILAMRAYMPDFSTSEFFGFCVSGIDGDGWILKDIPTETRVFARSVMENVMLQMIGDDPREHLKKYPANYERDV